MITPSMTPLPTVTATPMITPSMLPSPTTTGCLMPGNVCMNDSECCANICTIGVCQMPSMLPSPTPTESPFPTATTPPI